MKSFVILAMTICMAFASSLAEAKGGSGGSRPNYGGGKHSSSHGGNYQGGKGSSHKGGEYKNNRSGDRYGKHKP